MELILLLLFLLLPYFIVITSANSPPLRLELLHRHQVNTTLGSLTRSDRIREIVRSDLHRHRSITAQIRGLYNGSFFGAPIRTGYDFGIAEYFVEVSVGTPPQKFRLVADTGSELTWLRCRYKNAGDVSSGKKKVATFQPEKSSTFRTVDCSSRTCKVDLVNLFALTKCPTPSSPCSYHYRYAVSEAEDLGIFAYDTVTIDFTNKLRQVTAKIALERVVVGCTHTVIAETFNADGVLGLAHSNQSFTSKAAQAFGPTFSYCLLDHLSHLNRTSYLTFGPTDGPTTSRLLSKMRYTTLELNALSPFYAVNIKGISVGGKMLNIPPMVWDPARGGGTLIESSSSVTFLTQHVYQQVVGALHEKLKIFRRFGPEERMPFEYCFDASQGYNDSVVPRLVIHFADGARFKPPVKNYVIHVGPGIRCLNLVEASWPAQNLIGNIMLQNHFWSFNVADRKLGFAPSTCV